MGGASSMKEEVTNTFKKFPAGCRQKDNINMDLKDGLINMAQDEVM